MSGERIVGFEREALEVGNQFKGINAECEQAWIVARVFWPVGGKRVAYLGGA